MLLFAFLVSGCSDWLQEDDSSKLTYDFYATEKGIDAALVATYSVSYTHLDVYKRQKICRNDFVMPCLTLRN